MSHSWTGLQSSFEFLISKFGFGPEEEEEGLHVCNEQFRMIPDPRSLSFCKSPSFLDETATLRE